MIIRVFRITIRYERRLVFFLQFLSVNFQFGLKKIGCLENISDQKNILQDVYSR